MKNCERCKGPMVACGQIEDERGKLYVNLNVCPTCLPEGGVLPGTPAITITLPEEAV